MGTERRCNVRQEGRYEHTECGRVREKLRAVDFALVETTLYLDAYPHCAEALAYYHKLLAERHALAESYAQLCGPLTAYANMSETCWQWVKTPWPWELDAN